MTDRKATPWALSHKDEERERSITATEAVTERAQAALRDEQWHTALLIRSRYRWPESWLECLGLGDVPAAPDGWCTCKNGDTE